MENNINEYLLVLISIIIGIGVLLIILGSIRNKPIYFRIEQELIDDHNIFIRKTLHNAILDNLDSCIIEDYWGYKRTIVLPKYEEMTEITKQLLKEDIENIIKEEFN